MRSVWLFKHDNKVFVNVESTNGLKKCVKIKGRCLTHLNTDTVEFKYLRTF